VVWTSKTDIPLLVLGQAPPPSEECHVETCDHVLLAILSVLASLLVVGSVSQQVGAAPAAFTHPGVLVSRAQLDYIRSQVNAGAQPQTQAYQAMMSDGLLSQSRQPTPRSVVECGPYSNPNLGCTNERRTRSPPTATRWPGTSPRTRRTPRRPSP